MKKALTLIMLFIITFSSFMNIALAEVDDNSGGDSSGNHGNGTDSCAVGELCLYYAVARLVGYRLSFVYVSPSGDYNNIQVSRTSTDGTMTKTLNATLDVYFNNSYPGSVKYMTSTWGSKAMYLNDNSSSKTFDLVRTYKRGNYVKGINYLTFDDPQLSYFKNYYQTNYGSIDMSKCLSSSANYCYGSRLMELFIGKENNDWNQLLETAKLMGIVPSNANLGTIKSMARNAKGEVLKLLIEPIPDVRFRSTSSSGTSYTAMTLTELITVLQANNNRNGWARVRWEKTDGSFSTSVKVDGNSVRYSCLMPMRFYLDHPDEELNIAQYKNVGITSYLSNNGINPCSSNTNLAGNVQLYKTAVPALMRTWCPDGNCYYNYNNSYFSTARSSQGQYRIIIDSSFNFRNLGIMIADLSDIFGNVCPVVYRTISLSNPFPGHDGSNKRIIGENWYAEDNSIVKKYITNNRGVNTDNVYNLDPMYKVVLTPSLIQSIRQSNARTVNGYNNDSLIRCDANGENCQSTFIRNDYKSSFSGCKISGTC